MKEIRARYFAQIELQDVSVRQDEVVFIDQEKLDEQLNLLSKIKEDMDEVVEKYPKAKVVSRWLSDPRLSEYSFNKDKIHKTFSMLNHERNLFRIRDRILALNGTKPEQSVFNFDFGETVKSSCSVSGRINKSPSSLFSGFHPRLERKSLKPFFLKFDKLVDLLVQNRELQHKAVKELPDWSRQSSPAEIYDRMFTRFVSGSEHPKVFFGSASEQVKEDFSQQVNIILASCSSGEVEFVERVGTWLPKGSRFLLEVVGNKVDRVPVYISLYGDTPNHDTDYLYNPLVENLKKKYGDPLFYYSERDSRENFWITDDGRLIVVQYKEERDARFLVTDTETRLSYVYLPTFIENFQSWLDVYNNEFSDLIEKQSGKIQALRKNLDEGLQSKL